MKSQLSGALSRPALGFAGSTRHPGELRQPTAPHSLPRGCRHGSGPRAAAASACLPPTNPLRTCLVARRLQQISNARCCAQGGAPSPWVGGLETSSPLLLHPLIFASGHRGRPLMSHTHFQAVSSAGWLGASPRAPWALAIATSSPWTSPWGTWQKSQAVYQVAVGSHHGRACGSAGRAILFFCG